MQFLYLNIHKDFEYIHFFLNGFIKAIFQKKLCISKLGWKKKDI